MPQKKPEEPDRFVFGKGVHSGAQRGLYAPLLEEWYGDKAENAIAGHLPKTLDFRDVLNQVTDKLISSPAMALGIVTDRWQEIVGTVAAARIRPVFIEGTVLLVELKRQMFRSVFDTPEMKKCIVEKVNAALGKTVCTDVRFVAAGMFRASAPAK